jgi:hypothetical protein
MASVNLSNTPYLSPALETDVLVKEQSDCLCIRGGAALEPHTGAGGHMTFMPMVSSVTKAAAKAAIT